MDIVPIEKLTALNPAMCEQSTRLQTFQNWPKSGVVTPLALSHAGFYYLNRDDWVECAFCLVRLHNWKQGDQPSIEHQRHSPHCSLIKDQRFKCIKCECVDVQVVYFPCLHMICCEKCAIDEKRCIICHMYVISSLTVRFRNKAVVMEQCG